MDACQRRIGEHHCGQPEGKPVRLPIACSQSRPIEPTELPAAVRIERRAQRNERFPTDDFALAIGDRDTSGRLPYAVPDSAVSTTRAR